MRLTDGIYASTIRYYKQFTHTQEDQAEPESENSLFEEPAVLLDLSLGMRKKDEKYTLLREERKL